MSSLATETVTSPPIVARVLSPQAAPIVTAAGVPMAAVVAPIVAQIANSNESVKKKFYPAVALVRSQRCNAETTNKEVENLRKKKRGSKSSLDSLNLELEAMSKEAKSNLGSHQEYILSVECDPGLRTGRFVPCQTSTEPENTNVARVARRWNEVKELYKILGGYHLPALPLEGIGGLFSKFSASVIESRGKFIVRLGNYLLNTNIINKEPAVLDFFGLQVRPPNFTWGVILKSNGL